MKIKKLKQNSKKSFFWVLLFFLSPVATLASSSLLLCNGLDCAYCKKLLFWDGLLQFLFWLSLFFAIVFFAVSGYFYLMGKEDGEEKIEKAKNFVFYGIISTTCVVVFFTALYFVYEKSGSAEMLGFYGFNCGDQPKSADSGNSEGGVNSTGSDESGFLGSERVNSGSLNGGTRPNQSNGGRSNNYLQNTAEAIVSSGNLSGIVSGDNRIIKLNSSETDPFNLISDISVVDPDEKIDFVVASKDATPEEIIDYRNVSLGFDKDKIGEYTIRKDNLRILGDEVASPDGKVQELFSVTSTDVPDYFVMDPGESFKPAFESIDGFKEGNLNKTITQVFGDSAENIFGSKDIYAFSSGVSNFNSGQCQDSGGEATQFQNQCFADREQYSDKSLECSNIYNPVTGCDCPDGYYLSGGTCTKNEMNNISDTNNTNNYSNDNGKDIATVLEEKNPVRKCSDVALTERQCPPTRCEGSKLVYYPKSVKDECSDGAGGPIITSKYCEPTESQNAQENSQCANVLSQNTYQAKVQEAKKDPDFYGKTSDWYDQLLNNSFGQGTDAGADSMGNPLSSSQNGNAEAEKVSNEPLPPDKGALNFNPTPGFEELKKCIGLKGDQIPYNGILVVLLNPSDPLNRKHKENISRMYYLSRDGKIIGKNGDSATEAGGQEYGARTFDKAYVGDPNGPSMWGRGWKIFNGTTTYNKNGWTDKCSFGSHDGYKTGTSQKAMYEGNLRGGIVSTSTSRCGQHVGDKNSSAGCATLGNGSRCGFINTAKSYMSKSNGTIMQINLLGELNSSNGKLESSDCGKIDYCGVKRLFEASAAKKFKNDPNDGYDSNDKRRITDC